MHLFNAEGVHKQAVHWEWGEIVQFSTCTYILLAGYSIWHHTSASHLPPQQLSVPN